ncbi:MAG: tRNA (guanosine(37)-N1)-methyltransferase TrmD [Lachnospiraceae bacterium]|nr:tRNA (guanosine(37)-N1)-methyltransferase TrmD [Lachnospiraceae bacterium]
MNVHILTLFPEMIMDGLHTSILARAMDKGLITLEAVNIRDYTLSKHKKVDDYTYGGGAGMLMQAQPVYDAYMSVKERMSGPARVIYMSPQGKTFDQELAMELSQEEELVILCGHYEGIDERVLEEIVTDEISIGDYVLTGGELPAMVVVDAVSRLIPGVLGNRVSSDTDSFMDGLLEYPQYSRPEVWRDKKVPDVLLSGNHAEVDKWRRKQSLLRTRERRPDLYEAYIKEHPEAEKFLQ